MANKSECYAEALSAIKNFTQDELQNYVKNVLLKSKEYEALGPNAALDKAIQEANDYGLKNLYESVTTNARNVEKFKDAEKDFISGKSSMPSFLVRRGDVKGKTVLSSVRATQEQLVQYFHKDITEEEKSFMIKKANNQLIFQELDGIKTNNVIAKKIADRTNEYMPERNARLINSTAMTFDEINEDRKFRAVHVDRRLINGGKSVLKSALSKEKVDTKQSKAIWKDYIKSKLDILKTFRKTNAVDEEGNVDYKKVDDILSNIYDNITTGKSNIFTKSAVVNDLEAIEKKSHMFFVWKDWRSLGEYNERYGQGDFHSMLMRDIMGSANRIGASRLLGSNPDQMYNALRKVQVKNDIDNGVNRSKLYWHQNDIYYKNILHAGMNDTGSTISNIVGLVKTFTSIGRLGFTIAGQSLSDIGYVSSFAQRCGASSYFKAWSYHIAHLFNILSDENRKYYAKMMSVNCQAHLGYMGRFSEASNFSEVLNKISTGFFKVNFLHAFDNGNRIGGITMWGTALAKFSNNSLDRLSEVNPEMNKFISKFLNKDEWDLLRTKNQDGRFATDNAESLTDEELRQYKAKTGIDTPLFELRNDLYRNIHAMFDVTAENAVLTPGAFEKALLGQGLEGTPVGNILSLVTQFKHYTLGFIDRVLVQGYKDSDTAAKKMQWAFCLFMGTLPISMASWMLQQIGEGKSATPIIPGTAEWDAMNVSDRENYSINLIAPSLGTFAGFLGPNNQNSNIAMAIIGSPSTRFLFDLIAAATSSVSGDWRVGRNGRFTNSKKDLVKAADYFLPLQTIPGVSPYIDEALGSKPHLFPGQRQLYGA